MRIFKNFPHEYDISNDFYFNKKYRKNQVFFFSYSTCMTKSRLNLLFSTPVMNVTETYDLSNEQYKHLTSQEDLYQTTY